MADTLLVTIVVVLVILIIIAVIFTFLFRKDLQKCESNQSIYCPILTCQTPTKDCSNSAFRTDANGDMQCNGYNPSTPYPPKPTST